jgi:hypothetical protein
MLAPNPSQVALRLSETGSGTRPWASQDLVAERRQPSLLVRVLDHPGAEEKLLIGDILDAEGIEERLCTLAICHAQHLHGRQSSRRGSGLGIEMGYGHGQVMLVEAVRGDTSPLGEKLA